MGLGVQSPIPQERNVRVDSDGRYLEAVLMVFIHVQLLAVNTKSCLGQIALLSLCVVHVMFVLKAMTCVLWCALLILSFSRTEQVSHKKHYFR